MAASGGRSLLIAPVAEAKTLRREIQRVAADYDIEWQGELENLQKMDKYRPPAWPNASSQSTETGSSVSQRMESSRADSTNDGDRKIDLDKTIDEASELAERTKERADKAKDAERKGEVVDERQEANRSGRLQKKGKTGEERGKERAEEMIEKGI